MGSAPPSTVSVFMRANCVPSESALSKSSTRPPSQPATYEPQHGGILPGLTHRAADVLRPERTFSPAHVTGTGPPPASHHFSFLPGPHARPFPERR